MISPNPVKNAPPRTSSVCFVFNLSGIILFYYLLKVLKLFHFLLNLATMAAASVNPGCSPEYTVTYHVVVPMLYGTKAGSISLCCPPRKQNFFDFSRSLIC